MNGDQLRLHFQKLQDLRKANLSKRPADSSAGISDAEQPSKKKQKNNTVHDTSPSGGSDMAMLALRTAAGRDSSPAPMHTNATVAMLQNVLFQNALMIRQQATQLNRFPPPPIQVPGVSASDLSPSSPMCAKSDKEREQHKEGEKRRRLRIRNKFEVLGDACGSTKADRSTIISTAKEMIESQELVYEHLYNEFLMKLEKMLKLRGSILSREERRSLASLPQFADMKRDDADNTAKDQSLPSSALSTTNTGNIPMAVINQDIEITAANPEFYKLMDFEEDQLIGKNIFTVLDYRDFVETYSKIQRAFVGENWQGEKVFFTGNKKMIKLFAMFIGTANKDNKDNKGVASVTVCVSRVHLLQDQIYTKAFKPGQIIDAYPKHSQKGWRKDVHYDEDLEDG